MVEQEKTKPNVGDKILVIVFGFLIVGGLLKFGDPALALLFQGIYTVYKGYTPSVEYWSRLVTWWIIFALFLFALWKYIRWIKRTFKKTKNESEIETSQKG